MVPRSLRHCRRSVCFVFALLLGGENVGTADIVASSDFSLGDEGWRLTGDSLGGAPTFVPTGGNPGGYINGNDSVAGGTWYWEAPAKFLGNDSAAYGFDLSFDLRMRGSGPTFEDLDVILRGNSGGVLTLFYDTPMNPLDTEWTSYNIPLTATAGWKLVEAGSTPPTEAQMRAALSNVTSLRIRGEFITGSDNGDLDNVVLGGPAAVPEPTSFVLTALALAGVTCRRKSSPRRRATI